MTNRITNIFLIVLCLSACDQAKTEYTLTEFEYESKVDTSDHPIELQEKKEYTTESGITADNLFDAARLNDFKETGTNQFEVPVLPENSPINMSPWYAFRVKAEEAKTIEIKLTYTEGVGRHRYWPKLSSDRKNWIAVDSGQFVVAPDSLSATMTIDVGTAPLFVAAQEIIDSNDMKEWVLARKSDKVKTSTIGKSRLGRDLLNMDITNGDATGKDIVLVISRQHPPEVTGNLAMMHFLDEIVKDTELSNEFLDEHRVIVYPMMNPDGVDLGHWRHNEGGIDMNRDWAYYRQPEVRQICQDIIDKVNESGGDVKLGLDFHSTWEDIYYIFNDDVESKLHGFSREWIANIFDRIPEDKGVISPFPVNSPVSKNWFISQFNAEGITYEIGDGTPRDLIKTKGEVGAQEMMKLLLEKY